MSSRFMLHLWGRLRKIPAREGVDGYHCESLASTRGRYNRMVEVIEAMLVSGGCGEFSPMVIDGVLRKGLVCPTALQLCIDCEAKFNDAERKARAEAIAVLQDVRLAEEYHEEDEIEEEM